MNQQHRDGSVSLLLPSEAPATPYSVELGQRIDHLQWARERGEDFYNIGFGRFSIPLVQAAARAHRIPLPDTKRYVQYYRAYSQEEFDEMLALFRAENFALLFSCFRVLVAVKDKSKRKDLLIRAVQERCGAERLRWLMEETLGNSGAKRGRRPQVLKLSGNELEKAVDREIKKIAGHANMIVTTKPDLRPEFRRKLQRILDALQ